MTIGLLIVIAVGLLTACWLLSTIKKQLQLPQPSAVDLLDPMVDRAIARMAEAVQHHVDVNAVLELVAQLDDQPDAIVRLTTYPESVRTAALLYTANSLGKDLCTAQDALSQAHNLRASNGVDRSGHYARLVSECQAHVDELYGKLEAVNALIRN